MFCETTWQLADIDAAAAAALDTELERSDDTGRWTWLDDGDAGGMDEPAAGRTRAWHPWLDGDRLTASTNRVERAQAVSQLVAGPLPGPCWWRICDRTSTRSGTTSPNERHVLGEDEPSSCGLLDPTEAPPELRAALRRQMDLHEEQWVDKSIPALGGLAPRQALDDPTRPDPTRRDDLFRLLDRMEEMDARRTPDQRPLGMSARRLRERLGLPPWSSLRLLDG